MRVTTIVSIAACIFLVEDALSDSRITPEDVILDGISVVFADYQRIHGRLPTTWEEVKTQRNLDDANLTVKEAYGYSFQDRYEFVTQNLPMYGNRGSSYDVEEGSRVILARVTPFQDYRTNGRVYRTFIYQSKSGAILTAHVLEEKVRKLVQTYHVTLPVKPGVPPLETNQTLSKSRQNKVPDK